MASSLRLFLPPTAPPSRQKPTTVLNCTPTPTNPAPKPASATDVEARKKLSLLKEGQGQDKSSSSLQRAEPPNWEIGWKRTKEIKNEKPKGWVIADFLEKLEGLMGREQYGSKELLVKVGWVVAERAREEAEVLREGGEVEERMVRELYRVLKLMEMDFEMVRAAVKEETVKERVEAANARCRQAILLELSF